jgi:hypothetical protein
MCPSVPGETLEQTCVTPIFIRGWAASCRWLTFRRKEPGSRPDPQTLAQKSGTILNVAQSHLSTTSWIHTRTCASNLGSQAVLLWYPSNDAPPNGQRNPNAPLRDTLVPLWLWCIVWWLGEEPSGPRVYLWTYEWALKKCYRNVQEVYFRGLRVCGNRCFKNPITWIILYPQAGGTWGIWSSQMYNLHA